MQGGEVSTYKGIKEIGKGQWREREIGKREVKPGRGSI